MILSISYVSAHCSVALGLAQALVQGMHKQAHTRNAMERVQLHLELTLRLFACFLGPGFKSQILPKTQFSPL